MIPNKRRLFTFAKSLPRRCEKERDIILRNGPGAWDTRIRKSFWDVVTKWFCQDFELDIEEARHYVYLEGLNPIPDSIRGAAFFRSKMYPDAALILKPEFSIAIELDHGTMGSQVRNALSKASFSVMLSGYDHALVLFFVDSPMSVSDFVQLRDERKILDLYKKCFRTTLHLV